MQQSGWHGELWFDVLTFGSNMAEGTWGMGRRTESGGASDRLMSKAGVAGCGGIFL